MRNPDDANDDERQEQHPCRADGLTERDDPCDRDAHRADADPDGIAGARRQVPSATASRTKLTSAPPMPTTLGHSRLNPSDCLSAVAQTISSSPAQTRTSQAIAIYAFVPPSTVSTRTGDVARHADR